MMRSVVAKTLVLLAVVAGWVVFGPSAQAQSDDGLFDNGLEQYLEQMEEGDGEELMDAIADLRESPINLNDTTAPLPEWLVSTQLRDRINAYIALYGPLLSWDELLMVNGIDSAMVARLQSLCTIQSPSHYVPSLKKMLQYGHHNIVAGSNVAVERARGYNEGKYEGQPYRLYTRYRFHYKDYLSFQLSADKDAGEAFFHSSQKQGFDLYGCHLMVSNIGVLKRAVAGRYKLQFGQGLTLWSGSDAYYGWGAAARRNGRGICVASPFAEYDYLQGAAVTLGLPHGVELTTFYSYSRRDANIDTAAGVALSLTRSGYHRSDTELAKRHTLGEHLYGANLQWNRRGLHVGATAYGTSFSMPLVPKLRQYNEYAFRGQHNVNAGIDASYRYGRLIVYGEGAYSLGGGLAGLAGADFLYDGNTTFSILYRNYSRRYHSFYSNAWNRLSSVENEQGLRLAMQTQLPWQVEMLLQGDFYRHPGLRYGCYSPSDGYELRAEFSKNIAAWRQGLQPMRVALRYRYREYDKNKKIDNEYYTANYGRHTLYADFDLYTEHFHFRTRLGYSAVTNCPDLQNKGFLVLQDCTFQYKRLYLSGRVALFDVSAYEARLYATERDFMYEFASPAMYNKGVRCYLMARYNIYKGLNVGVKYSISAYADMESIGSGYDKTEGNHRQQIKVQVKYAW